MDPKDQASLEQELAGKLARLSNRHRLEALEYLGDSMDPERIPQSFWDRVERETNELLAAALILIFLASSEGVGADMAALAVAGAAFAAKRATAVASSVAGTIRDRLATAAAGGGVTKDAVATAFGNAAVVAATETTVAVSAGSDAGITATVGTSLDDLWIAEPNACPICEELHRTSRRIWARRFPDGPPGHPSCRCRIKWANLKA